MGTHNGLFNFTNIFFRDLLHKTRWPNNEEERQVFPACRKVCPKWNFLKMVCRKWCADHHLKWVTMECYPKIQLIKAIVITPPMRDFCHNCELEKHSGCNPTEEFSIVSPTVWRKEGFSSEKTRQLRLPSVQPMCTKSVKASPKFLLWMMETEEKY